MLNFGSLDSASNVREVVLVLGGGFGDLPFSMCFDPSELQKVVLICSH